jgi:hypothetical protein
VTVNKIERLSMYFIFLNYGYSCVPVTVVPRTGNVPQFNLFIYHKNLIKFLPFFRIETPNRIISVKEQVNCN